MAADEREQIAVEVAVAPFGRVVEEPAIELDVESFAVGDVAIDAPGATGSALLSEGTWQSVRAFDPPEVSLLEDRAGAVGDVVQHRPHPFASSTRSRPSRAASIRCAVVRLDCTARDNRATDAKSSVASTARSSTASS